MVKRLCKEEDVGYVDLWDSFVGKEEMYVRDGRHLSGKGVPFWPRDCQGGRGGCQWRLPVAVASGGCQWRLPVAVASGLGKVRYLN